MCFDVASTDVNPSGTYAVFDLLQYFETIFDKLPWKLIFRVQVVAFQRGVLFQRHSGNARLSKQTRLKEIESRGENVTPKQ